MNSTPGQIMTAVTTPIDTHNISMYKIIAIIIIFLIIASIIYYTKDLIYSEWLKIYPSNELTGETPAEIAIREQITTKSSVPATLNYSNVASGTASNKSSPSQTISGILLGSSEPSKADPVLETPASAEQTWCLVGEDMAGRWCIQVNNPKGCEPIRTYKSKNQCERSNDPMPTD
jgi:hypothetical protein